MDSNVVNRENNFVGGLDEYWVVIDLRVVVYGDGKSRGRVKMN